MAQKSISQGTLENDFELNKLPTFAPKVSNIGYERDYKIGIYGMGGVLDFFFTSML